jgi:hypothetical protein
VVNSSLLLFIKNNLQCLAAIFLGAETLANNLNGEHEIGEDGVVDGGKCSRTRSLLSEGCARSVGSLWARENSARCEDEDVAVGKLLLELTGETGDCMLARQFNVE